MSSTLVLVMVSCSWASFARYPHAVAADTAKPSPACVGQHRPAAAKCVGWPQNRGMRSSAGVFWSEAAAVRSQGRSQPDSDDSAPLVPRTTVPRALLLAMVFLHVLANALIAQALPQALRIAKNNDLVRTATALGKLGSIAALLDILITPQLGRLSDTIGRKPLLIGAPILGCLVRAAVALRPATPFLVAVKVLGGVISATYMVAMRAALADGHRDDPPTLTGRLGLVSAASGGAYAIGMYAGGELVARQLRLPYAVSASLLGILAILVCFGFRETHRPAARVPFRPKAPAVGFVRLFTSGGTLRGLCTVNALQLCTVSMGDTWQVFARQLRGWEAAQCGLFGSLTGLGGMLASLCVRSSVRLLGTRGHTLLATGCVMLTELLLGSITSPTRAFVALVPNWIGRTQTMAVAARITSVGATVGFGQGELAGDRQNLHALIKIAGPSVYGSLFALGCRLGVPALPFYFAAAVGSLAWLLVLLSPASVWKGTVASAASELPLVPPLSLGRAQNGTQPLVDPE